MEDPDKEKDKKPVNTYLKYSGLGLQLLLTMGAAGWLGYKLDEYLSFKYPVFMLVFGLIAFAGSIYKLYTTINKE